MERLTKSGAISGKDINELLDESNENQMGKTKAYYKLQEYEDLDEQGRLIKLPCKVGDTIYGLHKAMVCELDTETIGISKMPSGEILYLIDGWELDKGDFGKTVFLTKSEAEAKLKELRGANDGSME